MDDSGIRQKRLRELLSRVWYNISLLIASAYLLGFSGFFEPDWAQSATKNLVNWIQADDPDPVAVEVLPPEDLTVYSQAEVLLDKDNRISKDFKVPKSLKKRTAFWFDIYTKYGQYDHVIHHVRYPWIIFKVVNGNSIIKNSKGRLWQKRKKIQTLVAKEKRKLRKTLKRLSKKRSFKKLTKSERKVYRLLKNVRGKRRSVFKMAASNVRSQLGQKDFFEAGLERSSKYLPLMETEFSQIGLPIELTRLPFVESSFNEAARSKVGASGIWQIMPRTGRAYGIVGKYIDERNSPFKATQMAARVLTTGKRALKTWPLAVTAYNNGIGNIRKAIRASRSKDLGRIITRYHRGHFKFASANFYTSFLAALHAERYQKSFFKPTNQLPPLGFVEIKLGKRLRIKTVLKTSGLDKKTFLLYNRDLKVAIQKNILLPRGFKVHIPVHKAELFLEKLSLRKSMAKKRTAS